MVLKFANIVYLFIFRGALLKTELNINIINKALSKAKIIKQSENIKQTLNIK